MAPVIVRHVQPAVAVSAGLLVAAAGFVLLTQAGVGGLPFIVLGSIVLALGIAPVVTLTTDMIMGSAPPERAGAASAISETGCEFGGALGIALLGSLGTALYRSTMSDALTAEIPPEISAVLVVAMGIVTALVLRPAQAAQP